MKKVILTGFKPFGGYKWNPTEESTKNFHALGDVADAQIIGIVLPCTYYGAYKILSKLVKYEKPDAILSTGLSSSVKGFRIETTFKNFMQSKYPDADGLKPDGNLLCDDLFATNTLLSTGNSGGLYKILSNNGIPAELSMDADSFICNSLGYLTTKMILEGQLPIRNIFVHVPWTTEFEGKVKLERGKIFMDEEKYYTGLSLLLEHI